MTCSLVTGFEEGASVQIGDVIVEDDNGGTGNRLDGYQYISSTCRYKTDVLFFVEILLYLAQLNFFVNLYNFKQHIKQLSDQLSHVFRGVIADIIATYNSISDPPNLLFQPPQEPTQPKR
jgi:hypothetical protein